MVLYKEYFKVTDTDILGFFEEYRFLSNFYMTDVYFRGNVYPSSEHAYQSQKFMHPEYQLQFMNPDMTASQAKRIGNIKNEFYNPVWDQEKFYVMEEIVTNKFYRHGDLRRKLVATYPKYLVELNSWGDTYWGVDYKTGEGDNKLGKILMQIRDYWRE